MTYYQKQKRAEIEARTLAEAEYMVKTHATVRETAKISGVSKSTVHHDVVFELYFLSKPLYEEVRKVLNENGEESLMRAARAKHRL